jgi:hypothetical protein
MCETLFARKEHEMNYVSKKEFKWQDQNQSQIICMVHCAGSDGSDCGR